MSAPRPLAARHLAELAQELRGACVPTRVRAVEPLPPRDLLLVLEPLEGTGDGRVRRLRLSADPSYPRLHLQIGRVRRHEGPSGPFFRALVEALEGARLEGLEALPDERIARLSFSRGGAHARLLLEAIPRHANLVRLAEDGSIEDVLVAPPPGVPAAERLRAGAAWAPPAGGGAPAAAPLAAHPDEVPEPAPEHASLARLAPLSWRVEATLGAAAERALAEELRADLKRRVRRRLKGARSRREGLEARAREIEQAERMQHDAELLLAQHPRLGRGNAEVEVADDFSAGSPARRLALDPKRSGRENAEAFFARAKKLRRAGALLPAELAQAREQEAALETLLDEADDPARDPFALEREALADGRVAPRPAPPSPHVKKAKAAPPPRLPYRVFRGLRGGEIRVGRSARDNDELSLKISRGSDLWLHTSDSPGSHVVLRLEKGAEPHPEEVLDAAHLAVHFSPLAGARRADVHVARCKELKKPRGAPPGLVSLAGGRTLHVRMEEERLRRLFATAKEAAAEAAPPSRPRAKGRRRGR